MSCDVVVIGGGIVGTATALALTSQVKDCRVLVVEKEATLAAHQTGNNSGVIHSGLYYRPGSLKAKNCVEGRDALYAFCAEHAIAHEQCGKVVVATSEEELPALAELERRGRANGLKGVERLDAEGICRREPHVQGVAGLLVPETGIVDFVEVVETYARLIKERGGAIRLNCAVMRVERHDQGFVLHTNQGRIETPFIINCAGLQCDRVALMCGSQPHMRIVPFRGEYYTLVEQCRSKVKHLIYPVPDAKFPFLGVHYTRMINGEVEAGPNAVLSFKREGYQRSSFSLRDTLETLTYPGFLSMARRFWRVGLHEYHRSFSKRKFVADLQKLMPDLVAEDIVRGGAGVRAQAVAEDGSLLDDFKILDEPGLIHVLNAPSPAATASLSIGKTIAEKAAAHFALKPV
ncbi:L-2-hydroxyglutarate oxidase [Desulfuromonas acetoxidans]|uniref:L-2-hydroxyglutarate oxidase n=1 Tax=Desulfuromonas acetoxidans TaxID=891 RepID=UPI0029313BDF|nr:L-2-hydroxyglutarate oxidase [Desulfuromonas acetoxidans]